MFFAEGLLPIDSPPVGLVTWYAASGAAVAVATSWLGVVSGQPPELHAGCCGQLRGAQPFAPGNEFAVNIPASMDVPILRQLLPRTPPGRALLIGAETELLPARSIRAPLLTGCTLQIECVSGRIHTCGWVPALAGDIVLLHRGGQCLDPSACRDFGSLSPLRADLSA